MKTIGVIAASALLLVMALIGLAPATLVDGRLAALTEGRLRFAAATGTIWRGAGALTDAGNTWQLPMAWKVAPAALARGELNITIAPVRDGTTPQGSLALSSSGIALTNFRALIPAQALAGWLPLRDAAALGGDVNIDATAFRWNGTSGTGSLNARWLRARVASAAGVADLGTVEMQVTPQDPRLVARVTNSGGDVRVNGTINATATGNDGDITIAPVPGAPPALVRAVASLGRPDTDGAVRLAWRNAGR